MSGGANKGDNFNSVLNTVEVKSEARGRKMEHRFMAKSYPMLKEREDWLREVRILYEYMLVVLSV